MNPPTKRRKVMLDSLKDLVKQGKNDELKSVLPQMNPLDLVDNYGTTLLHLAAKYNNTDLILYLLESNCNIDVTNSSGATPLFIAVKNHSFDAVKVLLDFNANIFATNAAEFTILDTLLSQNTIILPEVFESFLQAMQRSGTNINTMVELFMKSYCNLEIILSLREPRVTEAVLKSMVIIEPVQSQSALYFAMKSFDLENIYVLLNHGPNKDARITLFFENVLEMIQDLDVDLKSLEIFIRAVIDWDIISKDKLDYFHNVLINGSQNVVQVLLNCNLDVHVKQKFKIDLISGVFGNRNIDVIELFKNRKFNVNAQGFRGYSALHFALRSQSLKNVQFLIDHGANLNIKDQLGKTPLLDCHAWNEQCLGQLLLQHGADIQIFDNAGNAVYNVANFEYIYSIVIPHLAILIEQNDTLNMNFELLIDSNGFVNTYELCCQQLRSFKEYKITESVVLFDVLTRKVERIATELRDVDFTLLVNNFCFSNKIVPYYSTMLEKKLQRAMIVYRAMRNIALIVSAYTDYIVDYSHLVIERIFSFLTYCDVYSLVQNINE